MLMASDVAISLDPALLGERVGLTLDSWQQDLLRTSSRYVLILAPRQVGKSTTVQLRALHTALWKPSSLTLALAPAQRQSQELFRGIMDLHSRLEGMPKLVSETTLKAEFSNGSRIIALPGSERTTRGYAGVDLIIIDEAARVDDALIAAVRPMMATKPDSQLIALTTPFGQRGFFYENWTDEDQDWERVMVTVDQCPRITPEFLAAERKALGELAFSEEYGLSFNANSLQMFSSEMIERAFSDASITPLWG